MRHLAALLLLLALAPAAWAGAVGVRRLAVPAPDRAAPLAALVWYPAAGGGTPAAFGGNAVFRPTEGLRDAALAPGRHPLVLIEHGGFRSAPQTAAWLARALAARGFIAVLAWPPHLAGRVSPAVLGEFWRRPADLSAALDAALRADWLRGRVDRARLGAVGFFLAGTSVLQLAGARADAAALGRYCEAGGDPDCGWLRRGGVDPAAVDRAALQRAHRDPRLRSVVVVDPEFAAILTRASLRSIAVPVHLFNLGPHVLPRRDAAGLARAIPGARYTALAGVPALASFPLCTAKGAAILAQGDGEAEICAHGGTARAAAHATLAAAVAAALEGR